LLVEAPLAIEPSNPPVASADVGDNKFCIYCGSSNKTYAAFCEKCGKQIG